MYAPSSENTFLHSEWMVPLPSTHFQGKDQDSGNGQTCVHGKESRSFTLRGLQVTLPSVKAEEKAEGKGQVRELEATLETGFSHVSLWFR